MIHRHRYPRWRDKRGLLGKDNQSQNHRRVRSRISDLSCWIFDFGNLVQIVAPLLTQRITARRLHLVEYVVYLHSPREEPLYSNSS